MAYTTINKVAGLFPNFTRNGAKGPADDLIQDAINEEASEINAILQRRFSEAISVMLGATLAAQFSAYIASFAAGSDQLNVLERVNKFGAAGQLAAIFRSSGVASFEKLAKEYEDQAQEIYQELDGRDEKGQVKKDGGRYDKLFDANARSVSPRPEFFGVAGGDQPRAKDEDVTDYFKKWPGTRDD